MYCLDKETIIILCVRVYSKIIQNFTVGKLRKYELKVFGSLENIVGKGEYNDNEHFFHFPKMFSEVVCLSVIKTRDSLARSRFNLKNDVLKLYRSQIFP